MRTTNLRKAGGPVVAPQKRPRYELDELLAQCDPTRERTRQERQWLDGKPAGRELG